jgi:hypothetical protein
MKWKQLLVEWISLVLRSEEGSKDWVNDKRLFDAACALFFATLFYWLFSFVFGYTPLIESIVTDEGRSYYMRIALAIMYTVLLLFVLNFNAAYFFYTLGKGNRVHLVAIAGFYMMSLLLFTSIYFELYMIEPRLYAVNSGLISPVLIMDGYRAKTWWIRFLFGLYSAMRTVGSPISDIQGNSILISVVNYVQTLYNFILVSLFVAGYVSQRAQKQ